MPGTQGRHFPGPASRDTLQEPSLSTGTPPTPQFRPLPKSHPIGLINPKLRPMRREGRPPCPIRCVNTGRTQLSDGRRASVFPGVSTLHSLYCGTWAQRSAGEDSLI